jgi:CubicO group peptidase (beta-lactamase class C family)
MLYKRSIGYLLLSCFFIILAGCQSQDDLKSKQVASAVQTTVPITVQDKITNYLLDKQLNGNVAIVKDGKTIYSSGVGYSNFKTKTLNQNTTTHPIGSITKSIVATCILQLQEKGMLNIQDPVAKYLPNFPNGNKIKLIHLLNHTSGIQSPIGRSKDKTLKALIQGIENRPVKFPAGSEWNYKDENYVILGYIVEKVSGKPLHKYIQKNIFSKAGMKDSGFISKENTGPATSVGYIQNKNQKLSIAKIKNPVLFGYADVYSTAYDLCMYDQSLMSGKLVSQKSLKEILTPGSVSNYGLGLYNFGYAVQSRGVIGGWESFHVSYKDNTSMVILLNVRDQNFDIHQVSKDLFNILEAETPNPRFHKVGIGNAYSHGLLVVR